MRSAAPAESDIVPPLVSELPLSYRSGDTDLYRVSTAEDTGKAQQTPILRLDEVDVAKTFTYRSLDATNKSSNTVINLPDVPSLHFVRR